MKSFRFALALLIGVSAMAQAPVSEAQLDRQGQLRQVLENFGQSALTLEQNRGQAPQDVDFVALGLRHKFLLSPSGATLQLFDTATKSSQSVQLQLAGASPSSRGEGLDRVAFTSAYFTANDPEGRLRSLPNFAKVRYRDVWRGIDVVYYGNRDKLEYDMVVAPNADPHSIRIKLTGQSRFALNSAGDLELRTHYGTVIHHRPLAFQVIDHHRKEVRAEYALVAGNEVRIQLGKYDRSHELVIDPTLSISSPTIVSPVTAVLAGVDGAGNIYVALANGQGSITILVFGSTGTPLNQGTISGADTTAGMVVTSAGKVYVTGAASSNTFPTNGYQTKLADPEGLATDAYFLEYVGLPSQNVLYGTFFGGVGNDSGNAIAVDGAGNAYITGQTVGGTGFVHTTGGGFAGGGTDAFVAKFNPTVGGAASLIFSTFIGGNGADSGNGIGVDGSGNGIYVGGATTSTSASFQPTSATGYNTTKTTATNDGFIVKLNSAGSAATWLTFIASAPVNALAVDSSFAAYVTGAVDGTTNVLITANGFQLANGGNGCASFVPGSACTDAFLSKYNTTVGGNASLLYSTYLGGTLSDAGTGVAVDNSGNAYVVGRTNSSNFPTARPLAGLTTYQGGAIVDGNTLNTQFDGFAAKINTSDSGLPSLVYSTYLGGSDTDQVNNVAIDASGNAFIGGTSSSNNFPNTTASASATGAHGFFAEITDSAAGQTLSITKTHAGNFFQGQLSATYTVTVANVGSGATSGPVTVTETVPAGLVLVSMSGTSWSCASNTCTRSDALAAGGTYSAITVTVNVNGNATSPQVNQVSVSGGGSSAANASDSTTIVNAVALSIAKTHSGNFTQGQQGAIYTVTVSNAPGAAATSGTVTVTETVPGGLALVSMSGTGWTCSVSPTCTRSDALAGGASYPPITVTVNVAGGAASPQNNSVSVSGGGSAAAIANDSTTILVASQPSLSITKTHAGNFAQGQQNATYTVTVSNNNAAATTSGVVTVTDTLPAGLTLVSMAGAGWNCSSNTCTRSDALAGGASYPVITVTVNVLGNATSPQVNQVSVSGGGSAAAMANDSTVISIGTPALTVNRTRLNFGYNGALMTSPQTVTVTISGGVSVAWTASSSRANVTVSPSSGTGSGTFQVTAAPPPGGGSNGAVITVTATGATGSPQQIQVNVSSVTPTMPFGSFDTPINNTSGIAGAIGVTGWALDSIEVISVGIWREPVPNEATAPNGLVFIGNANFVADARPDVAATYPGSPYQYRGGWGYLMLTNFLRNSAGSGPLGNGTYNLHVLVTNKSGTIVDLGTRTITVDNAHASKPFGTIDTPDQGGSATGNAFVNFGWALTQNPKCIPTDGSTITVIIDGVAVGHPTYNQPRSDIQMLFPGLCNTNGAVGFFFIDTTKLQNKVHTISWNAFDNSGSGDGLGSRYFSVFNAGGGIAAPEEAEPPTPESLAGPVRLRSGYDFSAPQVALTPDSAGAYSIEMEQLGRIELSLGASKGYLVVGDEAEELPLGSTLKAGVFYWQAPLGFLGKYELVFERPDGGQNRVRVNIVPKQYSLQ